MIRSKLAAGIIAVGTAIALVNAPVAVAQETGNPQQIGEIPTSSQLVFGGIQKLFSLDKQVRERGLSDILMSPLFSWHDTSTTITALNNALS